MGADCSGAREIITNPTSSGSCPGLPGLALNGLPAIGAGPLREYVCPPIEAYGLRPSRRCPFSRLCASWPALERGAPVAILQFLHLWSLGIEEQFYIFFPVIILACSKVSRRFLPVSLVSMLVISLFFSQRLLSANPIELFYLLPFRAFELLIGSLLRSRQCTLKSPRSRRRVYLCWAWRPQFLAWAAR